jgi:TolA-binding protein
MRPLVDPAWSTAPATQAALKEFFDSIWNLEDKDIVKRIGSRANNVSRRKGVDPLEVDWAQALALMKHGQHEAAIAVLKRLSRTPANGPLPALGMAWAQFAAGKHEGGFAALESLAKQSPDDPMAIAGIAMAGAWLRAKPPAGLKRNRMPEIESNLLAKLNPEGQAHFKRAAEATKALVADLPKIREKLLEPVEGRRKRLDAVDTKFNRLSADREEAATKVTAITEGAKETQLQLALTRQRYNSLLTRAQSQEDLAAINARYNAAAAPFVAELNRVNGEIAKLQDRIKTIDKDLAPLKKEGDEIRKEISALEKSVAAKLAAPPFVVDLDQERERLVAGGRLAPKPTGPALANTSGKPTAVAAADPNMPADPEPTKPKAGEASEKKAEGQLKLAELYRSKNNPAKEKEILTRLIENHPFSDAADKAKRRLEELEKQAGD